MSGNSELPGDADSTHSGEFDAIDLDALGVVGVGDPDPSVDTICFTDEGANLLKLILTEDIAPNGDFVFDYASAIASMGYNFISFA